MPSQPSPRVWFEIDTDCDPIGGRMHIAGQAPCVFDSWLELVALIERARARLDPQRAPPLGRTAASPEMRSGLTKADPGRRNPA